MELAQAGIRPQISKSNKNKVMAK